MENNSTTSLNGVTLNGVTLASNMYSNPIRLEVNEYYDKIEMIFEETLLVNMSIYQPLPNHKRYFKIVFSCVDGKWNKSERIYGEKIESYFKFD